MISTILFNITLAIGLNLSPLIINNPIELNTQAIQLIYLPESDRENSLQMEMSLGSLGLIDITKLRPKDDIESLNIKYAEIPSAPFKAQVILIDANRNGQFEYDSVDLVGLTSFNDHLRLENVNFSRSKQAVTLKIDSEIYELQFKEDGSTITLTKTEAGESQGGLTFPYRLPDMEVRALTKNARLNKSNGKYTYVEFWGTWCKPCIQIIPEIQSLKKVYGHKLNIISVDYQDSDIERVKEYIVRYKMNWDHLIANKALMREFATQYFPCGVLFDPEGNLIEYGVSPVKVGELLQMRN